MTRLVALVVVLVAVPLSLAQDEKKEEPKPGQPAAATTEPAQPATAAGPRVKLETTLGDIVLELNVEKAPISVRNFLQYVTAGFYNGTIFHRVMSNFMIQGGGFTPDLVEKKEGLRPPIKNEWKNGLKNVRGTIAMARTQVADSATAQFFINVVDNAALDVPRDGAAYAVFGSVVEGMDTVDKIRHTPVKDDPKLPMGQVVPVEPVIIKSATVVGTFDMKALDARVEASDKEAKEAEAQAKQAQEKQLADFIAQVEQETGKKVEKTPSGLMYIILQEGQGAAPQATDTVEVHYHGTFLDGNKFDSSVERGKPAKFRLNQVIKGWTEGVGMMKVGEKRKLIIPPDLAYGPSGRPGIPPNSTLVFDVELLSIVPPQ